jgi:hypothetical protein
MRCQRVRFVVARAPGGPVCGTCWRREPAAMHPCANCGTVTRLHHFALCAACACPEAVRGLLTAADGTMRPAAQTVFEVLATDGNPAGILKWLSAATPRTLLANLAACTGALDHATLDQLRPVKAAAWLRAVLVANGALPARDEYLASLERWIDTATTVIGDPDDRRLVRRFATWHYLRRLRQRSTARPTSYGQVTVVRAELTATIALLAWLRSRGHRLTTVRQADIDDWLAAGPAGNRNAGPFVTWAVRRGHARDISIPLRTNTHRRHVFAEHDQRWTLVRRLLHETGSAC